MCSKTQSWIVPLWNNMFQEQVLTSTWLCVISMGSNVLLHLAEHLKWFSLKSIKRNSYLLWFCFPVPLFSTNQKWHVQIVTPLQTFSNVSHVYCSHMIGSWDCLCLLWLTTARVITGNTCTSSFGYTCTSSPLGILGNSQSQVWFYNT